MYCPRCNLHSEEYVDKCPLCAGEMEVDGAGSGLMNPPLIPEKETSDIFPKEGSWEFSQEVFGARDGNTVSIPALELEQEKIIEEAGKDLPDEQQGDEKTAPFFQEEEKIVDRNEQSYQRKITRPSPDKKTSSLFIGIGVVIILFLIVGGYFYFFQSGEPVPQNKMTADLSNQEKTTPQPVALPPAPVVEKQNEIPEQPEKVTPSPAAENSEAVVPEVTSSETAEMIPSDKESKEPVDSSQKASETQAAYAEPKKEEAPLIAPAAANAPEKPKTTKAEKSAKTSSAKTKEIAPSSPASSNRYCLMVGAFKVEQNARDLQNRLQKKGYPVSSVVVDLPGKGKLHRVIVVNYQELKEARKAAATLKSEEKVSALIMKDGKFVSR